MDDIRCCLNDFRPGDCSQIHHDRYNASLLKTNELHPSPMYMPRHRPIADPPRTSSPCTSVTESSISVAKVTTLPRCRDSIISNSNPLHETYVTSTRTFNTPSSTVPDEVTMNSLFQPIAIDHETPYSTVTRAPLEVVPEMSELNIAHKRSSYPAASGPSLPPTTTTQPSPVLITFDSSSLQRHR